MTRIFEHPRELLQAEGEMLGSTEWMSVEQQRINQFADATDDHQWIHVDPDKAASGPFGACIAHGFLTLSLVNKFLPMLVEVRNTTMGINYGCDKVRFPNTVRVNQRIRGSGEILAVEEKPGAVQAIVRVNVEVEGEERPACVAETISRFYFSD
ncbi:MAG: MaoC family dehydratase [Gammaproteobacteria bacterium]|nr:MaoC family dehydratase [Gammaproteobacteria bacterium]MDH3371928.1 MaoC family dehydratase [Gammaproteobacteria bacterium]MDH3407743.1 MaoC family dehydratase [Gammaproteobacteria bacterium]MDH3551682.1 MaoC family dehydratase [Gammaproteobacteria bacterium]